MLTSVSNTKNVQKSRLCTTQEQKLGVRLYLRNFKCLSLSQMVPYHRFHCNSHRSLLVLHWGMVCKIHAIHMDKHYYHTVVLIGDVLSTQRLQCCYQFVVVCSSLLEQDLNLRVLPQLCPDLQ